jgi:hypothetical protein
MFGASKETYLRPPPNNRLSRVVLPDWRGPVKNHCRELAGCPQDGRLQGARNVT